MKNSRRLEIERNGQEMMTAQRLTEMTNNVTRNGIGIDTNRLPTKYNLWGAAENKSSLTLTDKDYSVF